MNATTSPSPFATCLSRQLYEMFVSPSGNHLCKYLCEVSIIVEYGLCHQIRLPSVSQNAAGSAMDAKYVA